MWNVCFIAVAVVAYFDCTWAQQDGSISLYSNRYNNLNIDTILSSNRLVANYVDCLLSRKPCPPEGKDLKRILPEALRTKCARCSIYQKESALKVITKLYYDYPRQYHQLRTKWDPTGEYHRRFEEYLRGLQFNSIDAPTGNGFEQEIQINQQPVVPSVVPTFETRVPVPPTQQSSFNTGTPRPARNPEIISAAGTNSVQVTPLSISNETPSASFPVVSNRFGGDDDLVGSAAFPSIVTSSVQPAPEQPRPVQPLPTTTATTTTTTPVPTTARPAYGQPVPSYRPTVIVTNPILGLINSIGYKISNTAEFLAGIMTRTVQTT